MVTQQKRFKDIYEDSPPEEGSHLGDFLRFVPKDLKRLAQLQLALLKVDASKAGRRAAIATVLLVLAAAITLCAVTVLLFALSYLLRDVYAFTLAQAMGISGGGALLVAIILAWIGIATGRKCPESFRRSSEEFQKSIEAVQRSASGPSLPKSES